MFHAYHVNNESKSFVYCKGIDRIRRVCVPSNVEQESLGRRSSQEDEKTRTGIGIGTISLCF